MRTSLFMPMQANLYSNRNKQSFKGIESECLRKIAEGKIGSHVICTLVEGHLRDAVTPELQEAFNAAYRSGNIRQDLEAYLERKPGLKRPE